MPPVSNDHYQTLGIKRDASSKDIKAAFRRLARKYHPDTNQGDPAAEERFKDINEAYEVLSDEKDRRIYDRYGNDWRSYRDAGFNGSEPSAPPRPSGSGTRSRPASSGTRTEFTFTNDDDLNSMFGSMFGQGRSANPNVQTRARKGQNIEQQITISFDEAFTGTERRFEIQSPDTCPVCNGAGLVRGAICPRCDGSGTVMRSRAIDVTIPAGVSSGSRVAVRGQGGPGQNGGSSGDVFLIVSIRPDPRFEIDGQNIRTTVDVPVLDAILGGEVTVTTPTGRVALTIPAGTQSGKVFRLRQQGMPNLKSGERGDLLATVSVKVPTDLSDDERRQYEALRTS